MVPWCFYRVRVFFFGEARRLTRQRPLIGGMLERPAEKFPALFGNSSFSRNTPNFFRVSYLQLSLQHVGSSSLYSSERRVCSSSKFDVTNIAFRQPRHRCRQRTTYWAVGASPNQKTKLRLQQSKMALSMPAKSHCPSANSSSHPSCWLAGATHHSPFSTYPSAPCCPSISQLQ